MIVARAPLRLSLGGGGSDLPAHYEAHGGFLVAASLDHHVEVRVRPVDDPGVRLKTPTGVEHAPAEKLTHGRTREALAQVGIEGGLDIESQSTVPGGTGLGSSGAYTVALLHALHAFRGDAVGPGQLAEEACHVEMVRLREPCGKQDPYIAAFGGCVALTIARDGTVVPGRPARHPGTLQALEARLIAMFTGQRRQASAVLGAQQSAVRRGTPAAITAMERIQRIGHDVARCVEVGDVDALAAHFDAHWAAKRSITGVMSTPDLDAHHAAARAAGATGGKLVGAGGGGYFFFHVPPSRRGAVESTLLARGLTPFPFRFSEHGSALTMEAR